jgi:hypothetical protein
VLGEIALEGEDPYFHSGTTFCFPLQASISIAKTEVRAIS